MSETNQYVDYGSCACGCSGAKKEITGCRFSLSPMSDQFIDIILSSISKVHTDKVWSATDKLSTVYRGKQNHVMDAVKACFIQSYREGVHMTMEATVSKGCPGDTDAESYLAEDDILLNEPEIANRHFPVACKISLYPMGVPDYMRYIADVVNMAIDCGVYEGSGHYVTILQGDVQDLFAYYSKALDYCRANLSHYILEITLSVNSPTAD